VNTAVFRGYDALEGFVEDTDSASVSVLKPGIALSKSANPAMAHVGDIITYTFEVTNGGNTPLSDVQVTDNLIENIVLTGGDVDEDGWLDVAETWVFSANYTVAAVAPDLVENTAGVSGRDALLETVIASDSVIISILKPAIYLEKSANTEIARVGDNIIYTFEVNNAGNTPLTNILVTDHRIDNVAYASGDSNGDGLLDVGESWIFSANYTVTSDDTSPLVNTAIASGQDGLLQMVTSEDSTSVAPLMPSIDLEMTAEPAEAYPGETIT
jgi:uncharacterized repeat protein (TIGR01451 family)